METSTTTTQTTQTTQRAAMTIEVEIKKVPHNGTLEWSIEPQNFGANKGRYISEEAVFKGKWNSRNGKQPPPNSATDDHFPIVFNVGETLNFRCPAGFEFAIGAKKNADVNDVQGAPDNPFGLPPNSPPVVVPAGGLLSAEVKTPSSGLGTRDQAFFKFYGWVLENGTKVDVDPDGYCGS